VRSERVKHSRCAPLLVGVIMSRSVDSRSSISSEYGFAMLEALIAIVVFSVGVLGIMGVQAQMIKHTADAKYRAEASYIAQQRIGMMWGDPANAGTFLEADTDVSGRLPGGLRSVTQPVLGQYVVRVTWQQPGQAMHTFTTTARIDGGA
jgi:type IV pilus assembly protein PilV